MFDLPTDKPKGAKHGLYALGRLPVGTMNKTETRFSVYLEYKRLQREILWWRFDAVKLRLAASTFISVDFAVLQANGELHMIDVKPAKHLIEEDAKSKMKIAADIFPLRFFYAFANSRTRTDDWTIEEI